MGEVSVAAATAAPAATKEAQPPAARQPFSSLSPEEQEIIRQKQRANKDAAKARKNAGSLSSTAAAGESVPGSSKGAEVEYPRSITQEEYFDACPRRLFFHSQFQADKRSLDSLMSHVDRNAALGRDRRGLPVTPSEFQYYTFGGSLSQVWDPEFYARLAWEGFFTITTELNQRGPEPLPELQPFYGVIDWKDMNEMKLVRKVVRKLQQGGPPQRGCNGNPPPQEVAGYHLYANRDIDKTYRQLDAYQTRVHGTNWMSPRYMQTMKQASANPNINFTLQSIELYDGDLDSVEPGKPAPRLIAGEIGYAMGAVYTSLSGFYEVDGAGTVQLVTLGKWLEHQGFAFWSLGHCYSPHMDYKRQLGHRVYPRAAFLQKLRRHRGSFSRDPKDKDCPRDLALSGKCDFEACLQSSVPQSDSTVHL